jgi:hypothetical protein
MMAYDDAARFLAQVVPWPDQTQSPPEFFVNIHTPYVRNDGKPGLGGRACLSVREALNYIGYVETKKPTDVYVCMSAQKIAQAKVNRVGRTYWTAKKSALAAAWHKSFYIDIDVKAGAYPDSKTALAALGKFCEAVDLPMPTFVIGSGSGGIHAHWVVDEPIKTDVWLPLAQALIAAMHAHGLIADYGITKDAARIMRVPDSFNHKHSPPKPVTLLHADAIYTLERIERALAPYRHQTSAPARTSRPSVTPVLPTGFGLVSQLAGPVRELMPNQTDSLPSLADLRRCCPFVRQAHVSGGVGFRQPLWWETAKLAFYTRDQFHALEHMANGHVQYTLKENLELFERVQRERTPTDSYGWPLCDTIEKALAAECASCPWNIAGHSKGHSPLHFIGYDSGDPKSVSSFTPTTPAAPTPAAPVTSGVTIPPEDLPQGYEHTLEGRILREVSVEKDGKTETTKVLINGYRMYDFGWDDDLKILSFRTLIASRWEFIEIQAETINDPRAVGRELGRQGMTFTGSRLQHTREFLASFVEQLTDREYKRRKEEKLGWSYVEGKPDGFIYGSTRYNCKGNTLALIKDKVTRDLYRPVGEVEAWRSAFRLISNRMPNVATVCAAIGAPFMEFTGQSGVLINAFSSGSGHLKSTAMIIGQAAYAHPKKALLNIDTVNNVVEAMTQARNFGVLWDEIGDADKATRLLGLVFGLTQGRSKGRLNRASERMPIEEWSTALITASNVDLLDLVEDASKITTAALMRIFQYEVPALDDLDRNLNAEPIKIALNANYGQAFVPIAQWLGANASAMDGIVNDVQNGIKADFKMQGSERFYAAACTEIMMGARLLNKFELATINVDNLYRFLFDTVYLLRRRIDKSTADVEKELNLSELISQFINENIRNTVVTDIFKVSVGRGSVTCINAYEFQRMPPNRLTVQHAEQIDKIRFSRVAFGDFLGKRGYGAAKNQIFAQIKNKLGAADVRATIGGGTNLKFKNANEPTIELDLTRPSLQGLMSK